MKKATQKRREKFQAKGGNESIDKQLTRRRRAGKLKRAKKMIREGGMEAGIQTDTTAQADTRKLHNMQEEEEDGPGMRIQTQNA